MLQLQVETHQPLGGPGRAAARGSLHLEKAQASSPWLNDLLAAVLLVTWPLFPYCFYYTSTRCSGLAVSKISHYLSPGLDGHVSGK